MFRWLGALLVLAMPLAARASIADWRVNEVLAAAGGDTRIGYVELYAPPGTTGDCLFPTTRVEVFDASGLLLGTDAPFETTQCYDGPRFFTLASPEAAAYFGIVPDATLTVAIPAGAGQVCFSSSQTRYDCVRWGDVTAAERFLRNVDDATAGPPIPDGQALARIRDTGVVADDFAIEPPTLGRANDAAPFPDGGVFPDAAPPPPDAAVPDARVFAHPDAPVVIVPDAAVSDPRFLSADPGGGACACRTAPGAPDPITSLVLLALAAWRRRAGLRGGGRASGRAACRSPR